MNAKDVLAKANQILDEERLTPTVNYVINPKYATNLVPEFAKFTLIRLRSLDHIEVQEEPNQWSFVSTNYNLLCALISQSSDESRTTVVNAALSRIKTPPACARAAGVSYPNWKSFSSELPLVFEFCVRAGFRQDLFHIIGEANPIVGHMMLLRQLREMIALNFTALTDGEYIQLDVSLGRIGAAASKLYEMNRRGQHTRDWPGVGSVNLTALFHEIWLTCDSVKERCRKARYFYLKGSLLDGLNLEINQDKVEVQGYLRSLGFHNSLAESLDEADRLFHQGDNAFVLKSSMGHLRSFLENLHKAALPVIQKKFGGTVSPQWGSGLSYLRTNKVLSEAEEKFVAGLYKFISDEAVHPLFSDRKYARLARNVLIEYALLFLRKLEALGFKL